MKTKYFRNIASLLIVSAALVTTTAQAGVITWDYDIEGEFTSSTFNGTGATTSAQTLSWGTSTGAGQSSLVIDNTNANGQVNTYYGGGIPTPSYVGTSLDLTHNNNTITGTFLTGAVMQTTVNLDPFTPDNPALPTQSFSFNILFAETPNGGVCADPASPTPCNDIFVIDGGLPNFNFSYDAMDGDGLVDYFVNIFITDNNALSILSDDICSAAGAATGCLGFTTIEHQSNLIPFGFTISSDPVVPSEIPEPSSIALFGLAMLFIRRFTTK